MDSWCLGWIRRPAGTAPPTTTSATPLVDALRGCATASSLGETFVSADVRREFIKSNLCWAWTASATRMRSRCTNARRCPFEHGRGGGTPRWSGVGLRCRRRRPGTSTQCLGRALCRVQSLRLDMAGDGSSILFASANRSVRHPSYTDLYYTRGRRPRQPRFAIGVGRPLGSRGSLEPLAMAGTTPCSLSRRYTTVKATT